MRASRTREPAVESRSLRTALAAALAALALAGAGALAADGTDPLAGTRRLQERAHGLAPLADTGSGLTRDVGSIAIIEHDGSNYDAEDADGVPNYGPRAAVAQRFYRTHGDYYDFLVVFTNFDFKTGIKGGDALAFHNFVRNAVTGNGQVVGDGGAVFGSPGRLLGYVDMTDIDRYGKAPSSLRPEFPLSVTPGDPGFRDTLNVLAHEIGHQWLAYAHYRDASGHISTDLTTAGSSDAGHWTALLDSDASEMKGADWVANGDGTYTAVRTLDTYSSLDLYLMGLLDPAKVAPFTLLHNDAIDRLNVPDEGTIIPATPETVDIGQVIAAEGPRQPDFRTSPKTFRAGFIFLTKPGVDPDPDDLAAVDRIRQAFAAHFFALTRGAALVDTTLAEGPTFPPAPSPDLGRALAWLLAQQSTDGSWQDAPATAIRDSSAVLQALAAANQTVGPFQSGQAWVNQSSVQSTDFLARRALGLASAELPAPLRAALARALVALQNADGGFGAGPGYASDPLDTALVLRALAALKQPTGDEVRKALAVLAGLRTAAGGWPFVPGGETSTVATASAVLALEDWSAVPEAPPLLASGLAALSARQNADGGFGESPSTPYATALSLEALLRGGASREITDRAIAVLQATQLPDGSWQGSRYQTALVLGALGGGVAPNLVVPADGLVLDPPSAHEGQVVHVTAVVRNVGRTEAGPTHARLFDGDPRSGSAIASATVPSLPPGAEAAVSFDYPTDGHAGARTVFVVADADDEVAESREDDNATSRALNVSGLLPDLVVRTGDLVVEPYPPESGEVVQVSIRVANAGTKAADANLLRLVLGNPRLGGTVVGEAPVPPLGIGEAATIVLPWSTAGLHGDYELFAVADARYQVFESDETDNETSLPVRIQDAAPAGADLELAALTLTPSVLATIPTAVDVRAIVRNLGRQPAVSTVALYDTDPPSGPPVAVQAVTVSPRSSTTVGFAVTVATPGTRTYVAVADPDGTLDEADESNNRRSAELRDPQNTFDLEIVPAEVTAPAEVGVGETLLVTVPIHNRGTAPVTGIPVVLRHETAEGASDLATTTVSLASGESTTVTLSWTTSITGDAVPLAVVADPFDLLSEVSETNNRASFTVRIRPSALPNLKVSGADLGFAPDPPREGSAATVSVLVRNTSPVPAGAFVVRFYRGDPDAGGTPIGEAALSGLDPLSTATASILWSPVDARGAQGIFAIADATGAVEEYDETDNRAFRPFSVLGLPDLVLAVADVTLDPRYPRSGEPVTVHAAVRNLGGQASSATTLRAFEGEPVGGVPIGQATIPPLEPGHAATVDIAWTPSAPPGEKTLSVFADADDVVREQDEGNNLARRSVIVQDADLFLTETDFSPDGDGVRDDTSLAYRATGAVTIVVSDAAGHKVRTLAADAPASGQVTWDGRDDHQRMLADGAYTLTLTGEGGRTLGRLQAVIDTNRSTLHDAAGTDLKVTRNLTCQLPDDFTGPAWMPSEDAVLLIVTASSDGFVPGLVRVSLSGEYTYVAKDDFYAGFSVRFASPAAVSPDGREVLLLDYPQLLAVDLSTGARRAIGEADRGTWSPDGRWIATNTQVFPREGGPAVDLPEYADWTWSLDSERLAAQNRIVRRDGTGFKVYPLPDGLTDPDGFLTTSVQGIEWRTDGRLFLRLGGDPFSASAGVLLDPDTGAVEELGWLADPHVNDVRWSPDASRALSLLYRFTNEGNFPVETFVTSEDGSSSVQLVPFAVDVSPHAAAGTYYPDNFQPAPECVGRFTDLLALASLHNLTAELRATRLPVNNGVLLSGTAADHDLDHYQLEYATQAEPEVWHPLGPASEVPVIDDAFMAWVPPGPGTYLVRLTAVDRAGNARAAVQVVSWDRVPILANITQSEFLFSPNGDGRRDEVTFRYLVLEPTHAEVRIVGPETKAAAGTPAPTPPTVRHFGLEYPDVGPGGFTWDGRDEQGQIVPDGRYTVFIDDLPFRVDVDATPPDVAWSNTDLRVVTKQRVVDGNKISENVLVADRVWHIVDPRLKSWSVDARRETQPIYEPVRTASGDVVYDNGVARMLLVAGRPVDRREEESQDELLRYATAESGPLVAEDQAGNRSTVPILPVEQRLILMRIESPRPDGVYEGIWQRPAGPIVAPQAVGMFAFHPIELFTLVETARATPADGEPVWFEYRPAGGAGDGAWSELGPFVARNGTLPASIAFAPLHLVGTYEARFTLRRGTPIVSDSFQFTLCEASFQASLLYDPTVPGDPLPYTMIVAGQAAEPLVRATLEVTGGRAILGYHASYPMEITGGTLSRTVLAPRVDCDNGKSLSFSVTAVGASGREYTHDGACRKMIGSAPSCDFKLSLRQQFAYCEATPGILQFEASATSSVSGSQATFDIGPDANSSHLGDIDPFGPGEASRTLVYDASLLPEGELPTRGRLFTVNPPVDKATLRWTAVVDHTPPTAEIPQPIEGEQVCVSRDPVTGEETTSLTLSPGDAGEQVEVPKAERQYRGADGVWREMSLLDLQTRIDAHQPSRATWRLSDVPDGAYALRLGVCDRVGLRAQAERHVTLSREPPEVSLVGIAHPLFSPNGDGRSDTTTVTVRTRRTLRVAAEVRDDTGASLVAVISPERSLPAGDLSFTWDGRDAARAVVPDGRYRLVVTVTDPCGRSVGVPAAVEVDATPPVALIVRPASGDAVGVAVDVRGVATDAHFRSYALSYGVGPAPVQWLPVATGASEVKSTPQGPGFLGAWTTPATEGSYTLRLVAIDAAENQAEARATVDVRRGPMLSRLAATPGVFSPNGDGRRETCTLEYELVQSARVTLQVRDAQGTVLRTLESQVAHPAGTYALVWDGRTDGGTPAPEGEHNVVVQAVDPDGILSAQQTTTTVILDRTPPVITLQRPLPAAFLTPDGFIHGSIEDPYLASYHVVSTSAGGTAVELAQGAQARTDSDLASLAGLADGPQTLVITAEDTAENRATVETAFTLDSLPPSVTLVSPAAQAVLDKGADPIAVTGSVADANLLDHALGFGPGTAPSYFVEAARASTAGTGIAVGPWAVAGLPDGTYTLRLEATDRAGHHAEDRRVVTLDSVPPKAEIAAPADGTALSHATVVKGTASDLNLASWTLEGAPGPAATAFQWAPLAEGTTSTEAADLASWPLPPDGVHTLRLTVRDRAGHVSTSVRTVTVDTTPPATPTGLVAEIVRTGAPTAAVRLAWNANTETDLAGYRVARGEVTLTPADIAATSLVDTGRSDGTYTYSVIAVDHAGNASPPATLKVRVDLTAPLASLLGPTEGAALSGSVEVRGTAYSPDDFKEYRLFVGAGTSPTSLTLLRRSTLPVAAGLLGTWVAAEPGPHTIVLEAEDNSGNQAWAAVTVTVDTEAPEAPVLTSVVNAPDAQSLTSAWSASPSTDVAGYLVRRNGRIANAPGVVVGDLRAFLVAGPSYAEGPLVDGQHCYRIVAMDRAGNLSPPSNEICAALDNHAPRALILNPVNGARFQYPVHVIAAVSDLDVAAVQIQIKAHDVAEWSDLGPRDTQAPFETNLDPASLSFGTYDLRAVATDFGGRTDGDPPAITVTYGDVTPPHVPTGLAAHVDGSDVSLTWTAVTDADLAGYQVYRDGQRLTSDPIAETAFANASVAPGLHAYTVTAVDHDGNASAPSDEASADVYALVLEASYPVTTAATAAVSGTNARAGTTVQMLSQDAVLAEAEAPQASFQVPAVPLAPGANLLTARATDTHGNRSLPSNEIVLVSNQPPSAVTGLAATVSGHDVDLAWDQGTDDDLFGYVVRRDGQLLTKSADLPTDQAFVDANSSASGRPPQRAFDGDPNTFWRPRSLSATWTAGFFAPILIDKVTLLFPPSDGPAVDSYRIDALWEGRYLPLVRVQGNTQRRVEHVLPFPFMTDGLRIVLLSGTSAAGLAEVTVSRIDAVPAATPAFHDAGVADGLHAYGVAAIDRYGLEGAPATADAPVGDVSAPAAPTGLVAVLDGADVALSWNANSEPDVAAYVVARDGARIARVSATALRDLAPAVGAHRYTVRAVDAAGLESPESDPADVAVPARAPGAPVILFPTDAEHPVTLAATRTDVRGRADAGTRVSLDVNESPWGSTTAVAAFVDRGPLPIPENGVGASLSADGTHLAYRLDDPASFIRVIDLVSGASQDVSHPDYSGVTSPVLSPHGDRVAFVALDFTAYPYRRDLFVVNLATGERVTIDDSAADPGEAAWSPAGDRLAFTTKADGTETLQVRDLATGDTVVVDQAPTDHYDLAWSPDGTRLAFNQGDRYGDTFVHLRVADLAAATSTAVADGVWPDDGASWSSDGRRLAYTGALSNHLRVLVRDLDVPEAAALTDDTADSWDPRFDPTGRWLTFRQLAVDPGAQTGEQRVFAQDVATGARLLIASAPYEFPQAASSVPFHAWLSDGRLALAMDFAVDVFAFEGGRFEFKDVDLAPGENRLVARAEDPTSGLTSPDSDTVRVTVPDARFPDLAVAAEGLATYPPVLIAGQTALVSARIANLGGAAATSVPFVLRVLDGAEHVVFEQAAQLSTLGAGATALVSAAWTPPATGSYRLEAVADEAGAIAESREDNNEASRPVVVAAGSDLAVGIESDRSAYAARASAVLHVRLSNAGPLFAGSVRATVEDSAGQEVATVDTRDVSVDYGQQADYLVSWNTGTLYAGDYFFRVHARAPADSADRAQAGQGFRILADTSAFARLVATPPIVAEGSPAGFDARVENRGANVALEGLVGRLRIVASGATAPLFTSEAALPLLLPGAVSEVRFTWPSPTPPGAYTATFEVGRADAAPLATASAPLTVTPAGVAVTGALSLAPGDVLAGGETDAVLTVTNRGAHGVSSYALSVDVMSPGTAAVLLTRPLVVDLAAGETQAHTVRLSTSGLAAAAYPVLLRGGGASLDRGVLRVHGLIAPPSIDAPADGARVDTPHPTLRVNDGSSPEAAPLAYEFQVFGDAALTQPIAAARGVAQAPARTSWRVDVNLPEDRTAYWRARATDGFSSSAWTAVASFTVDAVDVPPDAPLPDSPAPGARVANRQPPLVVRNAVDADRDVLTYEFRIAADPAMASVLASAAGLTEGPGLTAWPVPLALDEDATYYWSARANDGREVSPWSDPVSFTVDTVNQSPSAPTPVSPVGGAAVATLRPTLVVANAHDPEDDPLTYRFEIDAVASFSSPDLQVSPPVPEGAAQTSWTCPLPLRDNTRYFWRAAANDGHTSGPVSPTETVFVNLANDPPGVPTLLDPVGGRTVRTPTPVLRVRNTTDADGDVLHYEFEVKDAGGAVVASAADVPEGPGETTWPVPVPLAEDATFTWRARAHDSMTAGDWSAPTTFRVDAVAEPPTGPGLVAPTEGAILTIRRPALVVSNATSPDGLPLSYEFELSCVAADGSLVLVDQVRGLPEGTATTSWTPTVDLDDASYSWRARASDPAQAGPWMASAHFVVRVDVPPAAPTGLRAAPGDGRVSLGWQASPEPDVTGYRVYRGTHAGGPYSLVGSSSTPAFLDVGLANGVTVYYVVTALDAHFESARSAEVAATPVAPPPTVVAAEVRFDPAAVAAECLQGDGGRLVDGVAVAGDDRCGDEHDGLAGLAGVDRSGPAHDHEEDDCCSVSCPEWVFATIELPRGFDAATIDVGTVRLAGSVAADPTYRGLVDVDGDGLRELRVRFRFASLTGLLTVGANDLALTARTPSFEVRGTARLSVAALAPDMKFTPQTLSRRSRGGDVEVQLTFCGRTEARDVAVSSLRLNGRVPVSRVVSSSGHKLIVKFDRNAVIAILPVGAQVEVTVTGTARGVAFQGRDVIRVTQ